MGEVIHLNSALEQQALIFQDSSSTLLATQEPTQALSSWESVQIQRET